MPSNEEIVADWPRAYAMESHDVPASDGTRLRMVVAGPEDARRVILLHGAPQFSYQWRHVMNQLRGRYRVIAPDLRGYGASDFAASGRYDLDTLVGDLETVVHATRRPGREAPVVLVAHDWGGPIAWRFAQAHPELVRHLVAANAPHPGAMARELFAPRQAIRSWYVALFQIPKLERLLERTHGGLFMWMLASSARAGVFAPDDLAVYRAAVARPGRSEAILAYYRDAFGPGLWRRRQAAVESPRVTCPATVVWGEGDMALAPTHPDAIRPYAARLEIRRLPGVSHWVAEERPEEVVRAVLDGDQAG